MGDNMLSKVNKIFNYIKLKGKNNNFSNGQNEIYRIPSSIDKVKEKFKRDLELCSDLNLREIAFGKDRRRGLICYFSILANKEIIDNIIIKSMMDEKLEIPKEGIVDFIIESVINECEVKKTEDYTEAIDEMLSGNTLIFIDGQKEIILVNTHSNIGRAIEEPQNEMVVRGPKEGFTEDSDLQIALIRKKIKDKRLKFEEFKLGEKSKTTVVLCYVKGIAKENIIDEVKKRLSKIKIDAILDSGYIEQFIEENPYSPFSTVGNSQKPDVVAGRILEGRIAILCNGTPHVLTVPYLLIESIQVSEDYYNRTLISSLLRIVRVLAILISVFLPGIFVALQSFHQEMITTVLLITMAAAREGVPFPAVIEALLMNFFFEILKESGTRLPRAIGSSISIVGALVLGEAGVNAGIVGAPMVMIIALTGVSAFIAPDLSDAITIYRVIFIILGGSAGFYGIALGVFVILTHLLSMKSFGIPYTMTISPFTNFKDTLFKPPIFKMKKRPEYMVGYDINKQEGEE